MSIQVQFDIFKILSGGILFMFLYHLIQFIVYKEKTYLFYSSHLFFIGLNFLIIGKVLNNSIINNHQTFFLEFTYITSFIFYNIFIYSQLKVDLETKIKKSYLKFIAILFIYLIGITFFYPITNFKVVYLNLIIAIFIRILLLLLSFYQLRLLFKRYTKSVYKYLLIGTSIMVLTYAIHVINNLINGAYLYNHFFNLTGTLIEVLLFTYALNLKKRTAEIEKELAEETSQLKSQFFTNISHEFRTPLTLIKSPLQHLQNSTLNDTQTKQLNLIDSNANRMLELIDQLLELSKIDHGKLQIILKSGNLNHFLNSLIEPFSYKANNENINFSFNIQKLNFVTYFDKDILTKIICNLLDNAFKYNDFKKPIYFHATQQDSYLHLQISNSNSQLKETDFKRFFERFYQKDNTFSGFGIGLAMVKELIALYQGTIKTELENQLITFTIKIPLKRELQNAIVINEELETNITSEDFHENDLSSEKPILLIVDDNSAIREVIKDIFKNNYQIIEASNGKEALKIAQKEIPDCIISDVMMPEINGFELTKEIKRNELTSFIPVLLVTAKTSDEDHLKALENTADAFLTKPFNHNVLKASVTQIINERKKLQKRYSQELILKPTEIIINSVDEKFINRLEQIINEYFVDSLFTAELFAEKMNMSRMQLHRKLKSLFGVSTSEFIRNERLKMASELLKNKTLSISEIAYTIGFNDLGYFSKCFKEKYNFTPTEYQNLSS